MKNEDMKDRFLTSLRTLSKSSPIDKITVRQIAEQSGVTTQTFYNYFPDKYELVQWGYRKRLDRLLKELIAREINYDTFLRNYLKEYREDTSDIINAATNIRGQNSYVKESSLYFCSCVEKELCKALDVEEAPIEYKLVIELYIAGFTNLVLHWLDSGDIDMEDVITALKECVPQMLRKAFTGEFIDS